METTNPNSLSLLKEHINSLKSKMFSTWYSQVKNHLIKLLISSKSAENSVTIQISDTVDPKSPLKEIQKGKENTNKNLVNTDFISMSLDTNKSNITETRSTKIFISTATTTTNTQITTVMGVWKWWSTKNFKWKLQQLKRH